MTLFSLFISHGILGLLAVSMISSIIPIPTEPVVFALLDFGKSPNLIALILITGSILGAVLGYLVGRYELRKLLPFHDKEKEKEVQEWFRRYGAGLLLVSPWIPIVGDLAPLVAGIENYEPKRFILVISLAKLLKGIAIVYLSLRLIDWVIPLLLQNPFISSFI